METQYENPLAALVCTRGLALSSIGGASGRRGPGRTARRAGYPLDPGGEHPTGRAAVGRGGAGAGQLGRPGEHAAPGPRTHRAGRRLGAQCRFGIEPARHKHDPGAQQTQIDLIYGRIRSNAVRLARPDAKFEVHTPVGVAGVVGTDFYVFYRRDLMLLVVLEGKVRFCSLAGQCVDVLAGMISTVRGNNQPPDQPTQATPSQLTEAALSTEIVETTAAAAHHLNPWMVVGLVILAAAPAIAFPLATRGKTPTPPPQGCGQFVTGCKGVGGAAVSGSR